MRPRWLRRHHGMPTSMPTRTMTTWDRLYPAAPLWIGPIPAGEPGLQGVWDQLGWIRSAGRRLPVYIRRTR